MRAGGGWRLVQNCISAVVVKRFGALRHLDPLWLSALEHPGAPSRRQSNRVQCWCLLNCCSTALCCSTAQCCSLLFLVLLFSVWSKGSYTCNPVSELHLLLVRTQLSMRRRCPKRRGMRAAYIGDWRCARRCTRRCARTSQGRAPGLEATGPSPLSSILLA